MECNNCFASKNWNRIDEKLGLFDKNSFSNIKVFLKKEKLGLFGECIIYQSNCNDCKKSIRIVENLKILEQINPERKEYLIKILNKYSTN
ncbi:MAG: hypothetical protein ACRC8P_01545 [Spiroplasma sp.]